MDVLRKDTATPEVLLYYWQPENRRPGLMPTLIENPAIPESLLMELADTASRETVKMLLASARARSAPGVVEALLGNANLTPEEAQELQRGSSSRRPFRSSKRHWKNLKLFRTRNPRLH